jgi:hypothetical protein
VVDGAAKGHLAGILEQLGKFGVRLHAMTQMAQRLTPATRDAFFQNQSMLASTAGELDAVRLITRQWGRHVEPDTLVNLPRFHHVLTATAGGQVTTPFKVRGALLTDLFPDAATPLLVRAQHASIDANLHRRPIGDVLADLETLDERIIDALEAAAPPPSTVAKNTTHGRRRADGHTVEITEPTPGDHGDDGEDRAWSHTIR